MISFITKYYKLFVIGKELNKELTQWLTEAKVVNHPARAIIAP